MKKIFMIAVAVALTAGMASASLIVTAPSVTMKVGESTTVDVLVSGGDAAGGLALVIAIGDGGATVGGVSTGPIFTGASIVGAGTIFAANNTGQIGTSDGVSMGNSYPDRIGLENTTTSSGTIAGNGVLAKVTISAGSQLGVFAFNLGSDLIGASTSVLNASGNAVPIQLVSGLITVNPVPEPAALALLGLGGLFIRRRR